MLKAPSVQTGLLYFLTLRRLVELEGRWFLPSLCFLFKVGFYF